MLKETLTRLNSKTPVYFKKLRKYSLYLMGSLIAIITLNNQLNLNLNSEFIQIVGYLIVGCGFIAGTSSLPVQDK